MAAGGSGQAEAHAALSGGAAVLRGDHCVGGTAQGCTLLDPTSRVFEVGILERLRNGVDAETAVLSTKISDGDEHHFPYWILYPLYSR